MAENVDFEVRSNEFAVHGGLAVVEARLLEVIGAEVLPSDLPMYSSKKLFNSMNSQGEMFSVTMEIPLRYYLVMQFYSGFSHDASYYRTLRPILYTSLTLHVLLLLHSSRYVGRQLPLTRPFLLLLCPLRLPLHSLLLLRLQSRLRLLMLLVEHILRD